MAVKNHSSYIYLEDINYKILSPDLSLVATVR